ncbi:MAG TPA: ABC transporter ATP-binding protein [Gemmatimonadaceae bacterium]|nr:ABC transporter ATP-binding protein [Gemmatimonadaceae bacterium]
MSHAATPAIPSSTVSARPTLDTQAPAVRIAGLTKRFPERRPWRELLLHPRQGRQVAVLRNVTIDIARGEFFGLLGPNGAGKTTLFKTLATLILPDEGNVSVAGHDVVHQPAAVRRALAPVIADERSLYWRLTARANLALFAALQGLREPLASERVDELLAVVELLDVGEKMVGAFSSGMKQRLLIARALLARPQVLLLDEPTRSLDPLSARALRRFLRAEISERQGCTVLLATHNAEEALELCDRVAVLDHGRLLASGSTDALAAELGDERYRVWTRDPEHPSWRALTEQGAIGAPVTAGVEEDGWVRVEMEISGGLDRAAHVVAFLACQGVAVARFERITLSLADLIERIVARSHDAAPMEDDAHA